MSVALVAAFVICAGCHSQASLPAAAILPTPDQEARQRAEARRAEYVASLLSYTGDQTAQLVTKNLTRAAVEAAMGAPDHVWQGDSGAQQSRDTVYLYYLTPDAAATSSLRDKTVNGMRKQYRFVFYGYGNSTSPEPDELRIYDASGYGGKQITKFITIESSHLLW